MIDPKELRLGNLAYLKQETKSDTVVTICVTDLVMLQEGKKHLLPIPITEDWLRKMGFAKHIPSGSNTPFALTGQELTIKEVWAKIH
jgi:hypothetical protein